MPSHPHVESSRSLSSETSRTQGRSQSWVRGGNTSRPGDEPSPEAHRQHQDNYHGATEVAVAEEFVEEGQFGTLPLAIEQHSAWYRSTQALWGPECLMPYAYIGSWALETVTEEPVDDMPLTLPHCPGDNAGSRRELSYHAPFSLAGDSTVVDYWSNAPIHTDAWHLIEPTQFLVSPGGQETEGELSDMGATRSASPEGAQWSS